MKEKEKKNGHEKQEPEKRNKGRKTENKSTCSYRYLSKPLCSCKEEDE
jgi:hypothetical protein